MGEPGKTLISLNIRAGGGTRLPALLAYLGRRRPHTVVLPEWRDNAMGRAIAAWAERRRMRHAGFADGGTANGVFIASREHFTACSMTPPAAGAGVIALVCFEGFRLLACYFPLLGAKAVFFARCAEIAAAHAGQPLLLLGDLNTGNQQADRAGAGVRFACGEAFDDLATRHLPHDLWRRSQGPDAREWSWLSHRGNGFRIDHALANAAFVDWADPHCRHDHRPRRDGWTDHSAIIVRLAPDRGS
jgi:exonuclease III